MKINEILKRLIYEKGVNVSDVVRETGLSATPIYAILNGKAKRPLSSTIKKLADYFGVTSKYLLTGDDDEQEPDIAELRHEVAELKKRLNGPSFQKVIVDDYQRERLIGKYFKGGVSGVLLVELAGMPDKMLEEFIRVLYVYDEIKRRADANAGNNRKGNGDS